MMGQYVITFYGTHETRSAMQRIRGRKNTMRSKIMCVSSRNLPILVIQNICTKDTSTNDQVTLNNNFLKLVIIWHSEKTGSTAGWIGYSSLQGAGSVGRKEGDQAISRDKAGNTNGDVGTNNINEKKQFGKERSP